MILIFGFKFLIKINAFYKTTIKQNQQGDVMKKIFGLVLILSLAAWTVKHYYSENKFVVNNKKNTLENTLQNNQEIKITNMENYQEENHNKTITEKIAEFNNLSSSKLEEKLYKEKSFIDDNSIIDKLNKDLLNDDERNQAKDYLENIALLGIIKAQRRFRSLEPQIKEEYENILRQGEETKFLLKN